MDSFSDSGDGVESFSSSMEREKRDHSRGGLNLLRKAWVRRLGR